MPQNDTEGPDPIRSFVSGCIVDSSVTGRDGWGPRVSHPVGHLRIQNPRGIVPPKYLFRFWLVGVCRAKYI